MEITSGWLRAGWGALGGICAIGAKYLGQDHDRVTVWLEAGDYWKCESLFYGYIVMTIFLCVIGAIVAAASREGHPMKLLAIAVAGPAIITTYAGGEKLAAPVPPSVSISFITPALAEGGSGGTMGNALATRPSLSAGVKLFFGYGRDDSVYRVIAGSYEDPSLAAIAADKVRKALPDQPVYVGKQRADNRFYPVVVGGISSFQDAASLKETVTTKAGIPDAYLSPVQPD